MVERVMQHLDFILGLDFRESCIEISCRYRFCGLGEFQQWSGLLAYGGKAVEEYDQQSQKTDNGQDGYHTYCPGKDILVLAYDQSGPTIEDRSYHRA